MEGSQRFSPYDQLKKSLLDVCVCARVHVRAPRSARGKAIGTKGRERSELWQRFSAGEVLCLQLKLLCLQLLCLQSAWVLRHHNSLISKQASIASREAQAVIKRAPTLG